MYAVVKTGGKQLKVEVGETISVELLHADTGAVVTLPVLLIHDGENLIVGSDAEKATVSAEVLGHGKADKVVAFKFKKRKGYKKNKGHRQALTLLKVTDIALPGAKPAKAAKAEAATVAEKPATKAAAKKPAAKKPAVAKPATKTTAAKKPAVAKAEAAEKPAAKKAAAKKPAAAKATTAVKPAAKKPAAKKADADATEKKPVARKPAAKKTTKPADTAE
jgi:large subunit ribosomal protein L21